MTIMRYAAPMCHILACATLFMSQNGLASPEGTPLIEKGQVMGPMPPSLAAAPINAQESEKKASQFIAEIAAKTNNAILNGQKPDKELVPQITHFMSTSANETVVIINAGVKQGVVLGTVYDALRLTPAPTASSLATPEYTWIKTGEVKIFEPHDAFSLARITLQSTDLSRTFFAKFPGVMSGDKLVRQKITIVKNRLIGPTKTLAYGDLFVDPKAGPRSFELTSEGKEKLAAMGSYFADLRAPILLVEAYTDDEGPADASQIESYQRALTIRQYLVEQMGFEPSRIVAIGFGKADPTDDDHVPGYQERNRRIVFKVNGVAKPM